MLDCRDENEASWMVFVQLARHKSEHNLVAYQEDQSIYMVSKMDIEPGSELLLWYAQDYAKLIGKWTVRRRGAWGNARCRSFNFLLIFQSAFFQSRFL